MQLHLQTYFGLVVQLNRTSDSGSGSRGFESRRGHKYFWAAFWQPFRIIYPGGLSSGLARLPMRSESSRRGHHTGQLLIFSQLSFFISTAGLANLMNQADHFVDFSGSNLVFCKIQFPSKNRT